MPAAYVRKLLWLSGASLALFVVMAASWRWVPPVSALDEGIAGALHGHARESSLLVDSFRGITWIGTHHVLIWLSVALVVLLLSRGYWRMAAAWVIVQLVSVVLIEHSKMAFARPRPISNGVFAQEDSLSFPSGHALGAIVSFGFLAYLLHIGLPRTVLRQSLIGFCIALILLIGFSRMYLGVHYFTDILGGYALGAAWLTLTIALLEDIRAHYSSAGQYGGNGASTTIGS